MPPTPPVSSRSSDREEDDSYLGAPIAPTVTRLAVETEGRDARAVVLAAACDALPALVLVVDAAAPDGPRCVTANTAFEARFGRGVAGRTVVDVLGADLAATVQAGRDVEAVDAEGRSLAIAVRPVPGEETLVWSAWDRTIDAQRNSHLLSRNSDLLTENSGLQRANAGLQSEKTTLEQSNFDLDQFAYVASHDLAEPLRMVTSYLDLLNGRYADQLDERAVRYIAFATEGATRMRALIEDLLTLARVASAEAAATPVDLEKVLADVVKGLALRLRESGGVVEHDPLPVVWGNESQLIQLFTNLLANGLKFGAQDDPVLRVAAHRDGAWWRIEVDDEGPGVPEQFRDEVFDMFRRLQPRSETSGTGIGLAICKKVVERHGGDIGVTSAPTGGARFWFTLPANE